MKEMTNNKTYRGRSLITLLGTTVLALLMIVSIAGAAPYAYVANMDSHTVSVIDTETNTVTATVNVGWSPTAVAVSPDGSKVYVTNEHDPINFNSGSVSIINTATNEVTDTVLVGKFPYCVAVSPDGTKIYVTNYFNNNVSVIDTATKTVMSTVNVESNPRGVAVSPDGSKIYVANSGTVDNPGNNISVIDTSNDTVVATISIFSLYGTYGTGPTKVAITPDGTKAYVTNLYDSSVSVIDTATNTVIDTIVEYEGLESGPFGVAVSPDGSKVYVTSSGPDNIVSVIDTTTNDVTNTVPVGTLPKGLAVTPDGTKVYVTNLGSHSVSVINTTTNDVTDTVPVGSYPIAIAIGQFTGTTPAINTAPVADAGESYQVNEGSPVTFDASSSSDPDGDILQYRWDFESDETWDTDWLNVPTVTQTWANDWSGSATLEVSDGKLTSNDTATVTISNTNPVVEAGNEQIVDEGDEVSLSGSYSDVGTADTHTILWEFGDGSTSNMLTPTHVYADNGTYTATLTVTDNNGGVGTDTLTVTVENANPVVEAGDDKTVNEGDEVSLSGSFTDGGSADTHTIGWDFGDGSSASNTLTPTHIYTENGTFTATLTITDDDGGVGTDTVTVTVNNANPVVEVGSDKTTINEGDSVSFSGSYADAGSDDTHTFLWDFGDNKNESDELNPAHVYAENGTYTATLTVTDDDGGVGTDTVTITVNNVNPSVGEMKAPIDPTSLKTTIITSCTFTDAGLEDTHTGIWDWGDGTSSAGFVNEENGAGTITGEHFYADPGVYWVTLTVTDDDGGSSSATTGNYVVIYNPEGGFVTGGGWINSPENAYAANPDLIGKATFGFVSKYEKGATVPTGKTEFQFKIADLNFKSTSYDWLVVAGSKAKYKGTGTINGEGNYGFMLSAVDGDSIDKFRINIWDKDNGDITVYDNEIDSGIKIEEDVEPSTVISGGSIVVHKEK